MHELEDSTTDTFDYRYPNIDSIASAIVEGHDYACACAYVYICMHTYAYEHARVQI